MQLKRETLHSTGPIGTKQVEYEIKRAFATFAMKKPWISRMGRMLVILADTRNTDKGDVLWLVRL